MKVLGTEFDPLIGLKTTYGTEDNKLVMKYEQDTTAIMDRLRKLRDEPEYAKNGIKANLQHIGHIPDSVCLKMRTEHGFDAYSATGEEIVKFLRKHRDIYGNLIVTTGRF